MFVAALIRCRRALVTRPSRAQARSDAERRLDALLTRLASRQDRRLVAHIVERLAQIRTAAQAPASQALADRAAAAAAALVAVDARRDADASVAADPVRALEELRREEVARVVLRADLLRTASWLDRLGLGVARANAADSLEAATEVEQEIGELGLAISTEAELAALLAYRR